MKVYCRRLHRGDDLLAEIRRLAQEDLSTVGGHLLPGCIVNTTCELIVAPLRGWRFGTEQDAQTGYDEIVFEQTNAGEEA